MTTLDPGLFATFVSLLDKFEVSVTDKVSPVGKEEVTALWKEIPEELLNMYPFATTITNEDDEITMENVREYISGLNVLKQEVEMFQTSQQEQTTSAK